MLCVIFLRIIVAISFDNTVFFLYLSNVKRRYFYTMFIEYVIFNFIISCLCFG